MSKKATKQDLKELETIDLSCATYDEDETDLPLTPPPEKESESEKQTPVTPQTDSKQPVCPGAPARKRRVADEGGCGYDPDCDLKLYGQVRVVAHAIVQRYFFFPLTWWDFTFFFTRRSDPFPMSWELRVTPRVPTSKGEHIPSDQKKKQKRYIGPGGTVAIQGSRVQAEPWLFPDLDSDLGPVMAQRGPDVEKMVFNNADSKNLDSRAVVLVHHLFKKAPLCRTWTPRPQDELAAYPIDPSKYVSRGVTRLVISADHNKTTSERLAPFFSLTGVRAKFGYAMRMVFSAENPNHCYQACRAVMRQTLTQTVSKAKNLKLHGLVELCVSYYGDPLYDTSVHSKDGLAGPFLREWDCLKFQQRGVSQLAVDQARVGDSDVRLDLLSS